jgi:coenzyme F420-reducing hydrogenase alpha subunit
MTLEILQCVDEANDILRTIRMADEEPVRSPALAGTGMGVIEALRGLLYHVARIDEGGVVEDYDVIVTTAQSQINIENDLRDYLSRNLRRARISGFSLFTDVCPGNEALDNAS